MLCTWPIVWGCLCALVASTQSAAVSNKDSLVIVKPNKEPETIAEAEQQSTTEIPPIKVKELQAKCRVSLRYAQTTITSLVKNPASKAQQYNFGVLLPDAAFISGFYITVGGKVYKAIVKEKEEAKQIYTDAVSQGQGAAHVATMARNSNHFGVDINIRPNETVLFTLTYEEFLTRHNGLYLITVNMNPGTTVPLLSVEVHIKEIQKISKLKVPEITTGNEIIPTDSDSQNTKAVITRAADDREAKITFTPDIELQKKLMDVFAQKASKSAADARKQFYLDGDDESDPKGALGVMSVLYDVDRQENSVIYLNGGYMVHFLAPENFKRLPKHIEMVIDTSGSMSGTKIDQLRKALMKIIDDLDAEDYFSLIEFASGVKVHNLDDADKPAPTKPTHYVFYEREQSPKLVPPYKATPENKAKAKKIVAGLNAVGGTNIAGALAVALDLMQKGIYWKENTTNDTVTEPVTETETTTTEGYQNNKESRTTKRKPNPESDDDKNDLNNHQPLIIFLTDGEPTVGETNPKRIISNVFEKNVGDKACSIFSLAFGNGADRTFLRKLSLQNRGYMRPIFEAADAMAQMVDFYKTIAYPTIENVTFAYADNQVKKTTKTKFRTYFEGMEMVVAGKVDPSMTDISASVSGFCGVEDGKGKKRYEIRPKVIVPKKESENEYLPLEQMFAYLTIKQSLDEIDAAEDQDKSKEVIDKLRADALELALKYSFVTPLTSLVVVLPNSTNTVNTESWDGKTTSAQSVGSSQLASANFAPLAFRGGASPLASHSSKVAVRRPVKKTSVTRAPSSPIADVADHHPTPFVPVKPANTLDTFHLENYNWTLSILDLNTGEFKVQDNGVSTILKLSKDTNVPQSTSPCSRAINGAPGDCMYLTLCKAAQNITADQYVSTYCKIDGEYAGVCCPRESEPPTEIQPTESNCDAEINDQSDNTDNTSDNIESQDDGVSNDDTNSNVGADLIDTQNDEAETLNDEEESTPQDDAMIDDDTDSNNDDTEDTKSEDMNSPDSIDENPLLSDEDATH